VTSIIKLMSREVPTQYYNNLYYVMSREAHPKL